MNALTIKDLENLSGIKAHTIRIWEKRYSFLKPNRSGSNIRYYNSDELKMVLNVSLLLKCGCKISHIDKMDEKEISEKILLLSAAGAVQERLVNDLTNCMIDLDMEGFECKLDNYVAKNGIEESILKIIFPFLERIGFLWLTNHINPAHEHLVSNIIRHKLIVGIEGIKNKTPSEKKVLLFLPEGEFHELGLLFIYYLLKRDGFTVLYVGANIPVKDMARIARFKAPVILYSHLTSVVKNFNLESFLHSIYTEISHCQFVLSGRLIQSYKKSIPPNIYLRESIADVMSCIGSL